MVRQYHRLNGHEFEQTLGDSEGQGSLAIYVDTKSRTQLSDRITTIYNSVCKITYAKSLATLEAQSKSPNVTYYYF